MLAYMNTQRCRVQMMRAYFGEPEGAKCGLCDSCAGLDSEVFDPGSADERHGLHAATDFHARPRRRRRRGGAGEVGRSASRRSIRMARIAIATMLLQVARMTRLSIMPSFRCGAAEQNGRPITLSAPIPVGPTCSWWSRPTRVIARATACRPRTFPCGEV